MARLAREHQALELARVGGVEILRVGGVPNDQLVAVRVAREVADERARVQVGLLAPHALEARLEVLAHESLPFLALDAAPTPVQLEQHVGVEVAVDVVHRHLELARAPERRGRDRAVGGGGAPDGGVGDRRRIVVGCLGLLAQPLRGVACLGDQRVARLAVDELVHLRESLERVPAIEHARLVHLVGLGAVRVQDPKAEVSVDRGAADQERELEALGVELLDARGHLLGG